MSSLQVLTNERLNKLINETQETLEQLKSEFERRQNLEQEQEIMGLDNHFKSAELSLATIRSFIDYLRQK